MMEKMFDEWSNGLKACARTVADALPSDWEKWAVTAQNDGEVQEKMLAGAAGSAVTNAWNPLNRLISFLDQHKTTFLPIFNEKHPAVFEKANKTLTSGAVFVGCIFVFKAVLVKMPTLARAEQKKQLCRDTRKKVEKLAVKMPAAVMSRLG